MKKGSTAVNAAEPFRVYDCAPVFIATGTRAYSLRELTEALRTIHPGSIHFHFWGRLLGTAAQEPVYSNDLAAWTSRELRDKVLAERLSVIFPTDFDSVDELRDHIVDVIEERLDEDVMAHTAVAPQPFHFLRTQLVVFDTGRRVGQAHEFAQAVAAMSEGSIYYHFIEARRRTETRSDDFTLWLRSLPGDHEDMCQDLSAIDPYLSSLGELRERLRLLFEKRCSPMTT